MKKTTLLCALTLFATVAASGCGSSGIQSIDGDTSNMGASDSVSTTPVTTGDDTIVPDNTGTTTTDSGTTPDTDPTDTGSGSQDEKYCPAGTHSQDGNGTLCCRIDDPQICMIVDPLPPSGGIKPGLLDHLSDAVLVTDPTPPPPDSGGAGGSGGLHDSKTPNCYIDDRHGNERRAHQTDTGNTDDLSGRGCTMI